MIILFLTFWRTAELFSKVAAPFYIPTSNAWGLQFLSIFASTLYFLFFLFNCHPSGYEMVSGFLLEGFISQNSLIFFSGGKLVQAKSLP